MRSNCDTRKKFACPRSRQRCVSFRPKSLFDRAIADGGSRTRVSARQLLGENRGGVCFSDSSPNSTTSVAFLTVARNIAACTTRADVREPLRRRPGGEGSGICALEVFCAWRRRSRRARQARGQICRGRMKGWRLTPALVGGQKRQSDRGGAGRRADPQRGDRQGSSARTGRPCQDVAADADGRRRRARATAAKPPLRVAPARHVAAGAMAPSRIRASCRATPRSPGGDAEEPPQPARAPEDVVVPMSLRVTIVELRESMCKWPLGDPSSSEFRYCGSPAHAGTPYCGYHGKLAYQPAQDRRRERERDRRPILAR